MNIGYLLAIIAILVGLVGLVSIPVAYILYKRSRQPAELCHAIDFDIILDPIDKLLDSDLTMTIGKEPIKSISRSRIALWNRQGGTIRGGKEIKKSDPLRIQFTDDCVALQVRTLAISQPQNELAAKINVANNTIVDITFDFLEAGDGAIFEVVQQGIEEPTVLGTVIGAKPRIYRNVRLDPDALDAVKASRVRRFLDHVPRSKKSDLAINFVMGAIGVFLAIYFAGIPATRGHLVNASEYNLKTITGQADFSGAVQAAGSQTTTGPRTIAVICAILAVWALSGTIISFYRSTKQIIPKTVVAMIAEDKKESSNEQPDSSGGALPPEPSASQ
jgi:hypothetical protein